VWTDDGLSGARFFVGANGRVDSVRVAGGTSDVATTRYRYDTRGRVDSVADPLQHLAQRTWYAETNGNRSKDSLPGGRVTTYAYDAYGRDTSVSRPGLAKAKTFYSIINRPDSVRDGVNPVATRYAYDNLFLTSVTDPKGQVYGFTYNALGWLTQRTDPATASDQYKYSRDGELRRWTNRRGQTIEFAYEALHRPTGKSGTNTATESWAYPSDTVVVATSPVAVDTVVANRQGQLLRATTLMAGQNYVRRYTYTAAGALDSIIPSGGGIAFQARRYVWNLRRGTLSEIKLGAGPASTAVAYTPDGLAASVTLPGGDQVMRDYTSTHAAAGITTTASYSATVNRSSGLDIANRIQRHILSPTLGRQYSYDSLGRLVGDSTIQSAGVPCDPHNPPVNGDPCAFDPNWTVTSGVALTYDSAGNRRDESGA
jgi:YD repeat-containing protein